MPDQPKITFQLTAQDSQQLEVRVQTSEGEARGQSTMPAPALADMLAEKSAQGTMNAKLVDRIGAVLYKVLIGPEVDELVLNVLHDARQAGVPLLFELRFDPDQVALTRYPWEMICNPDGEFLVRDGTVDLTRYVTYPQPPPTFDDSIKGLPLFRVISSPTTLPFLSTPPLGINPIETLEHASFEAFSQRLLIDRLQLWGLHFDGHGALALQCARCDSLNGPADTKCWKCGKSLANSNTVGALAFENNGDVAWVPAQEFGSVLYNSHARLAMLLACETAKVGNKVIFSGLAPGLVLAGVPAVIGMQYPVLDTFAASFAHQFYLTLMKDNDIVAALRVARRMNVLDAWYSPALYLRRQPTEQEAAKQAVYQTCHIDTATPTRAVVGLPFLVRLWIRRPTTKPVSARRLRPELNVPDGIPVRQITGGAEVKFDPVTGRELRRGNLEIQLTSTSADVTPDKVELFIDEALDAPPAIFTVKAKQVGNIALVFNTYQDGGLIHSITHIIQGLPEPGTTPPDIKTHTVIIKKEKDKKYPPLVTPLIPRQPPPRPFWLSWRGWLIGLAGVAAVLLAALLGGRALQSPVVVPTPGESAQPTVSKSSGVNVTQPPIDIPTQVVTGSPVPSLCPGCDPTIGPIDVASCGAPNLFDISLAHPVNVASLAADCKGFAAVAPDFQIQSAGNGFLRIFVVGGDGQDLGLLVLDPQGAYHCNTDSFGGLNPTLDFDSATPGIYKGWLVSINQDTPLSGKLFAVGNGATTPNNPWCATDTPTPVVTVTASEAPSEACTAGWLPASGCTCCGNDQWCADGSVGVFNPKCACHCEGTTRVCNDGNQQPNAPECGGVATEAPTEPPPFCGNGLVETGELCDPPGEIGTSCPGGIKWCDTSCQTYCKGPD